MKTSKVIKIGRLFAAASVVLVATPSLASSNGLCDPTSCTLVVNLDGSTGGFNPRGNEVAYHPGDLPGSGTWSLGPNTIARLGGPDWQPIAGDYNNDGYDDIAVYHDGVFQVQWNVGGVLDGTATTTYTLPSTAHWGANTIPVSGNWDGIGGDDLGIYTDGMFRLFPVITDFSNQISISFGNLPQNPGYVFTQIPFSGPIDGNINGIDLVGVLYGDCVHYSPANVNSTQRFCVGAPTASNIGQVDRPGMFARPHVFEPGDFAELFTFMLPPDAPELDPQICSDPNSDFECEDLSIGTPSTEDDVVIPPDPFK